MAKRILMVSAQFMPEVFGGAEKQCFRLSTALVKLGLTVELLTSTSCFLKKAAKKHSDGELIVHRLQSLFPPDLLGRWIPFSLLWTIKVVFWVLFKKNDYDVIHSHQCKFGAVVAALISKITDKPLVIKLGNAGEYMDLRCLHKKALVGPVFCRFILSVNPTFIAITKHIKQDLISFGVSESNIIVIPNGANLEEFSSKQKPRSNNKSAIALFYHGRVEKIKRVDKLVEAFRQIDQAEFDRDIVLHIIGDGDDLGLVKSAADELTKNGAIIFHGKVDDVRATIEDFDIFVNASWAEGFSNSLLEAISLDKVCVSTPVSGASDAIIDGDNGFISKDFETQSLASSMSEAINLIVSGREYSSPRQHALKNFDINVVAQRYTDLYRNL